MHIFYLYKKASRGKRDTHINIFSAIRIGILEEIRRQEERERESKPGKTEKGGKNISSNAQSHKAINESRWLLQLASLAQPCQLASQPSQLQLPISTNQEHESGFLHWIWSIVVCEFVRPMRASWGGENESGTRYCSRSRYKCVCVYLVKCRQTRPTD